VATSESKNLFNFLAFLFFLIAKLIINAKFATLIASFQCACPTQLSASSLRLQLVNLPQTQLQPQAIAFKHFATRCVF